MRYRLGILFVVVDKSPLRSVLSQKLALKLDRGATHATLFGKSATLELHIKPILPVIAENMAVADVGVLESEAYRLLTNIPKEPAHLSEAVYGTRTEAEPLGPRFANHLYVEVIEAVIAIEPDPHKTHVWSGVMDMNLGAILHGGKSISPVFVCQLFKNPHNAH